MTRPARILLSTADEARLRVWRESLQTTRCQIITGLARGPADDIDVLVIDRPLSEVGVPLDEDRLTRGQIGLVAVGIGLPADVSLPADHSPRELRLACLLLSEIVRLRRQREASRRQERILSHLALSDPLTGLPNRRAWEQKLTDRLSADGQPVTAYLALLDIDEFKPLNDALGHLEGDACLKRIAGRLAAAARGRAFVARLGGDEFGVLIEGTSHDEATELIERIRQQAAEGSRDDASRPAVSLSAGWAASTGLVSRKAIDEALGQADEALRQAKREGRNCTRAGAPQQQLSTSTS
jgi:diguanylate cyclase (GGDEF)-like protein